MKLRELTESSLQRLKVVAIIYDVKNKLTPVLQTHVPIHSKLVLESEAMKIINSLELKLKNLKKETK